MPEFSEFRIVKVDDTAVGKSPTGRTDGVFTVILPSIPTEDDLITFDFGDVHGAIKEISGLKCEFNDIEFSRQGEDSLGLWQINTAPSRSGPDTDMFDCSELTQWASGTSTTISPDWLLS